MFGLLQLHNDLSNSFDCSANILLNTCPTEIDALPCLSYFTSKVSLSLPKCAPCSLLANRSLITHPPLHKATGSVADTPTPTRHACVSPRADREQAEGGGTNEGGRRTDGQRREELRQRRRTGRRMGAVSPFELAGATLYRRTCTYPCVLCVRCVFVRSWSSLVSVCCPSLFPSSPPYRPSLRRRPIQI
jgi:hypothetical protein